MLLVLPFKRGKLSQAGFTLVEVAVGLIIVGLATGSVLEGQHLHHDSVLSATYMRVQAYSTETQAFLSQYDVLPGDMADATTRLPHCINCANGDANGMIGRGDLAIYQGTAPGSSPEDENGQFWYHLSAAGLLTGFTPTGTMAAGATTWGISLPAAPAGGGYMVRSMAGYCTGGYSMTGLFIRWQLQPWQDANAGGAFVVSPQDAWYIDQKFDDGNPLAGKVQAGARMRH
jgi:prepilin-type N-terminal cleavage/methylation domain-containing protein